GTGSRDPRGRPEVRGAVGRSATSRRSNPRAGAGPGPQRSPAGTTPNPRVPRDLPVRPRRALLFPAYRIFPGRRTVRVRANRQPLVRTVPLHYGRRVPEGFADGRASPGSRGPSIPYPAVRKPG